MGIGKKCLADVGMAMKLMGIGRNGKAESHFRTPLVLTTWGRKPKIMTVTWGIAIHFVTVPQYPLDHTRRKYYVHKHNELSYRWQVALSITQQSFRSNTTVKVIPTYDVRPFIIDFVDYMCCIFDMQTIKRLTVTEMTFKCQRSLVVIGNIILIHIARSFYQRPEK